MHRDLRGWRVLLTGASQGIGEALALELAKSGARLALTARSEDKLDAVVQAVRIAGGEAHPFPADLTHEEIYKTHPKGHIGLQVHGIGKKAPGEEIRWRAIRIKEL